VHYRARVAHHSRKIEARRRRTKQLVSHGEATIGFAYYCSAGRYRHCALWQFGELRHCKKHVAARVTPCFVVLQLAVAVAVGGAASRASAASWAGTVCRPRVRSRRNRRHTMDLARQHTTLTATAAPS